MDNKRYDIFISYRRESSEATAKLLYDKLTELKYHVFYDWETLGAGNFNTALYTEIENCKDFLLILSPNTLDRCWNENDWVRLEIEYALKNNLNIIPIFLKDFSFPEELPDSIENIRYKNGSTLTYEYFDAFLAKLRTRFLISKPSTKETATDIHKPESDSPAPAVHNETAKSVEFFENPLMEDKISFKNESKKLVLGNQELERSSVVSITFLNSLKNKPKNAWDVSAGKNGFVMAWTVPGKSTRQGTQGYELYIASNGVITASSCYALFACYDNLEKINFNNCFLTNRANNMDLMFYRCQSLRSIDLTGFDTSKVTSMYYMFVDCSSLKSIDVSNFNTEKVINMENMFGGCSNLESLDLSSFDTSKVTNMRYMFNICTCLKEINLSSFDTSKVTDMSCMFSNCNSLRSLNLSNFNTSLVTDMRYMFYKCPSLRSIDLTGFDTSKVTSMYYMFVDCSSLKSIDVSNFNTEKVINMENMFGGCSNLESLDLSSFDTSKVTNMRYMFNICTCLKEINLSSFDTSKVTDMSCMFSNCNSLRSLNLSNFNTSLVTDMSYMFFKCQSLRSIDLSGFDTSKVSKMEYILYCAGINFCDSGLSAVNT